MRLALLRSFHEHAADALRLRLGGARALGGARETPPGRRSPPRGARGTSAGDFAAAITSRRCSSDCSGERAHALGSRRRIASMSRGDLRAARRSRRLHSA